MSLPDGTLISASATPHCGVVEREQKQGDYKQEDQEQAEQSKTDKSEMNNSTKKRMQKQITYNVSVSSPLSTVDCMVPPFPPLPLRLSQENTVLIFKYMKRKTQIKTAMSYSYIRQTGPVKIV